MIHPLNSDSARPPVPEAPERLHLDFLDGIRALAALYVVFGHAYLGVFHGPTLPYYFATNWLLYLNYPVDAFIVLSGFCLALPVARHGALRGGAAGFFRRRARRILPPYYAALALSLLLWVISAKIGAIHHQSRLQPDATLARVLLANALLLQDLSPDANWINTPFWSVAVEWKIYFLFPLFVWVWQRHGWKPLLAAAAVVGYGLTALLHGLRPQMNLVHTCPWYVFLFALGVCAAHAASRPGDIRTGRRWQWAVGGMLTVFLLLLFGPHFGAALWGWRVAQAGLPVMDTVAGMLMACALVRLGRGGPDVGVRAGLRLLAWKPLTFVGTFAYSIYLIHAPLLLGIETLLFTHSAHFPSPLAALPALAQFAWLALVGVPVVVGGAFLFSLAFERPFLRAGRAEANAAP